MNVSIKITDGKAYISIGSEAVKKDFDEIFHAISSAPSISKVRIDMKNLFYIRSELLAQILSLKKAANAKKASTHLLNVHEGVMHALEMSNLVQFFIMESDYGSYTVDALIDMFHSPEYADDVSAYMASTYTDEHKTALLAGAGSDDSIIREYSILTVGRAHDACCEDIIRKGLDSDYPNVVRAAILVLGWLGDMTSKERFYEFIQSPHHDVSEAAGASIALLNDDSDPTRLKVLGKHDNPSFRMVVAGTLSIINGDEAYGILFDMLKNEKDDNVRPFLVRRLAMFNKEEATNTLIGLLDDPLMGVQEAAAAGLERTGLRGNEAKVLKKVTTKDSWLSYFAVKALGATCTGESAEYLKSVYPNMDANVKLAIIEALGNPDSGATEFLMDRLSDENEDIRKEALSALHKADKTKGLEEAKGLVSKDPSWLVRYKAVEIIDKDKPSGYREMLLTVKGADSNRYIQEKIAGILGG